MSETRSYRPDPILVGVWALLASPPALACAYLVFKSPSHENLTLFAWTLVFPLLPILFASRFRATFTPSEFVYRRWGRTIRVPYSQIDRIEAAGVSPFAREPDAPSPKQVIGAYVVTKGGERHPFCPKLFPRDAVERFFSLVHSVSFPPKLAARTTDPLRTLA